MNSRPLKAAHAMQAVKAMHFDDDGSKGQLESADARKDRLAQEAELAQAIQDNPDGDDEL